MCGSLKFDSICSPVSPGKGYSNIGPCHDIETFVESEKCLCWVDWILPSDPLAANP